MQACSILVPRPPPHSFLHSCKRVVRRDLGKRQHVSMFRLPPSAMFGETNAAANAPSHDFTRQGGKSSTGFGSCESLHNILLLPQYGCIIQNTRCWRIMPNLWPIVLCQHRFLLCSVLCLSIYMWHIYTCPVCAGT